MGSLRISTSKNGISYYHYQTTDKGNGTYISRKNDSMIQKLAQKTYNEKVLKYAEKRLQYVKRLADSYDDYGIENIYEKEHQERKRWMYEHPLYLTGVGGVYPDFTVLSKKTRKEMYWEHNGRMDDPIYARKAVKKLQNYEKNNIFVGEKLILTYETEQSAIQTKDIERLVKKYLM